MKRVFVMIAAIAMVSLSATAFAQSPTDELFEKYGSKDGFTTVHVTKELFSLFADIADESDDKDAQDFQNVVKGLDYIRILMYDDTENNNPAMFREFKSELNDVKLKDFTELMTVKEDNEMVKFMIRKNGKNIRELLLLINQPDEAGFISITGNIDLKSIAKLSKSMNIKGLNELQKLNGGDKEEGEQPEPEQE